ncbi:MAG: hypothetical protein RJA07_1291 [Bacteroidota bacterium]
MFARLLLISFLFCSLMIATVGYHPIFSVLQNKIKHEMIVLKKNVTADEVIKISFSKNESGKIADKNFELLNDDEFIFNHHYFDIVKKIISKNEITYYCLCDEKETNLVIADMQQTQSHSIVEPNQKSSSKKIEKENDTINLFFTENNFEFKTSLNSSITFFFNNKNIALQKYYLASPPPKVEIA